MKRRAPAPRRRARGQRADFSHAWAHRLPRATIIFDTIGCRQRRVDAIMPPPLAARAIYIFQEMALSIIGLAADDFFIITYTNASASAAVPEARALTVNHALF